ncbi:MAG: hypothetical protein P1V97_29255 [Planctomycetota bacterium]|nr:hypothetical protein [Planctomycetota bacterium]
MTLKDTLLIEHTVSQEIPVGSLSIDIELSKQPFLVGPDAFYGTPSVANLVQSLDRVSIAKSDVKLKQVNYDVNSGMFSESSECSFRIRIHCALAGVENAVKVLESLKDVAIKGLHWKYDQLDEISEILVERSILEAKDRAQKRARMLSCKIVGVHRLETKVSRENQPIMPREFYGSSSVKSKISKVAKGLRGSWGSHLTLSAYARGEFIIAYEEDQGA